VYVTKTKHYSMQPKKEISMINIIKQLKKQNPHNMKDINLLSIINTYLLI